MNDIQKNKDIAAASYIPLLGAMILFLRRESPFVQFHARQGFVLFLAWIIFYAIPNIGPIISLLPVAGMIIGFLNAAQGEYYRLVFVADLAERGVKPAEILAKLKRALNYALGLLKRIFKKPTTDNFAEAPAPKPDLKKIAEKLSSAPTTPAVLPSSNITLPSEPATKIEVSK
jgi:uncharacterized membrane protein